MGALESVFYIGLGELVTEGVAHQVGSEGFPNVLLEAMASGCACVASDCLTGPADLIENERNGILLPPKATAADWVSVLGALLDDSDRCAALGTEAINVRQRYSEVLLRKIFIKAIKDLRPVAST